MNALELVKEYFPDKDDEFLENVLWTLTGFPCFWKNKEKTVEENLRESLQEVVNLYVEGKDPFIEQEKYMRKENKKNMLKIKEEEKEYNEMILKEIKDYRKEKKMEQLEIKGMPKKPRPKKNEPEVLEKLKNVIKVKLEELFPGEDNDNIANFLVNEIVDYNRMDGYKLAKRMDEEFYTDSDFEIADIFNGFYWDFNKIYDDIVKEWVIEQQIKSPFNIGDIVFIDVYGKEVKGEIVKNYEEKAQTCVFCESLGHIKEEGKVGSHGIIKNYEDVRKEN